MGICLLRYEEDVNLTMKLKDIINRMNMQTIVWLWINQGAEKVYDSHWKVPDEYMEYEVDNIKPSIDQKRRPFLWIEISNEHN